SLDGLSAVWNIGLPLAGSDTFRNDHLVERIQDLALLRRQRYASLPTLDPFHNGAGDLLAPAANSERALGEPVDADELMVLGLFLLPAPEFPYVGVVAPADDFECKISARFEGRATSHAAAGVLAWVVDPQD